MNILISFFNNSTVSQYFWFVSDPADRAIHLKCKKIKGVHVDNILTS